MKQRINIAFSGRFPSEKAAGLFVAENARALSRLYQVRIIVPKRRGVSDDPYTAYHLPSTVEVIHLPVIDLFHLPVGKGIAFYISQASFAVSLYRYLRKEGHKEILVANDLLPGLAAAGRSKLVFEVHDFPEHFLSLYRRLFKKSAIILATNVWKKDALAQQFPKYLNKIVMERNGVDLSSFGVSRNKEACRRDLHLSVTAKIVVYTGHLYSWKGVDTYLAAAKLLPDVLFVCVGGTDSDLAIYKTRYADVPNILFVGQVPHDHVPLWQAAADVLCLPNTARELISVRYTSPMKLFEYMASGRPIVASKIASIQEVLPETAGFFFTPDSAESLVVALTNALNDEEDAVRRAGLARSLVEQFSWDERTKRLSTILNTL
ncbi:MAG: hypothetical protein JWL75_416 [Parcubacteria group bacterium]|nr:hypothetical protein [Parcubacteria group bacterium]